jgi:hypothetical protein
VSEWLLLWDAAVSIYTDAFHSTFATLGFKGPESDPPLHPIVRRRTLQSDQL